MYRVPRIPETTLTGINSEPGESIEEKVIRILENKEPIDDGGELHYTERKDGVIADFNIRTDKFEVATEAMDAHTHKDREGREKRIRSTDLPEKREAAEGDTGPQQEK